MKTIIILRYIFTDKNLDFLIINDFKKLDFNSLSYILNPY
jgi:hypothetical protein